MSRAGTVVAGALLVALASALATVAEAQPPIRIGASVSQTGTYAALGQKLLRGYQLCVKHTNEAGGVLGRRLELVVEDDRSEPAAGIRIYEKLITQDKVDAVLGPYSSPITEAVADVTEKLRRPMVASGAATSAIFKKGRKFVFMVLPAAEMLFEGLIDMAARRGLKTIALIHEGTLFPRASAQGAVELAKKRGLQIVLAEAYPRGTTDFGGMLRRVKSASPDVLAVATYDTVAMFRLLKDFDINPKMFGATADVVLPEFYQNVGRDAEFVYGASQWEPELVTLRAGGLIPIARQYPGAREFVILF